MVLLSSFVTSLSLVALGTATSKVFDPHSGPNPAGKSNIIQRTANVDHSLKLRDATSCPAPIDVLVTAPKKSPFFPLSQDELDSVIGWLQDPAQGFNLTAYNSSTLALSDNYISHIEVLKPNKTDVLAYFEQDVTMPRHARIVLTEGAADTPAVGEYFVKLPISGDSELESLDYFYNGANGAKVLFNGGFTDGPRSAAIENIVSSTMSSIADITLDLVGFAYYGSDDDRTNGSYFVQNPSSTDGTTAVIWTPWRRSGLAPYDQPSDLYVSFEIGGTDASLYKMRMILYNLVLYNTTDEFRAAYEAGQIVKSPPPTSNTTFLHKDRTGSLRDLETRLAPAVLSLDGKRFKVDHDNRYIEYLGWKFYTRFDKDVGIQFYEVYYKGEKVFYELALQDAIAQYAGNNPFQAGTAYSDRYYGIGAQINRVIPGYDCPYGSTYFNLTYTEGTAIYEVPNAICIFETDIGTPITRHTDSTYSQSTKGSKLVIRQIATVGNYDYLWDYGFYVDGTVSVDAHASGYVQGNYYRPDDNGLWGPRIQETIAGTLHTHVMNFKADFDLINSNNTFYKTDIIVENVTQAWFPERGTFEMMRYNITELQTEDEGLLPVPANGQSMYTIVNKDMLNEWGNPRGYRILPGLSNVVLASRSSPFFLKSGEFAKHKIGATLS